MVRPIRAPRSPIGEGPSVGAGGDVASLWRATHVSNPRYLTWCDGPARRSIDGSGGGLADPALDEELQVMEMIADGMKDSAIARRLGVSIVTVRRRASRFRRRVGATTRTQAVAIATREGILGSRRKPNGWNGPPQMDDP